MNLPHDPNPGADPDGEAPGPNPSAAETPSRDAEVAPDRLRRVLAEAVPATDRVQRDMRADSWLASMEDGFGYPADAEPGDVENAAGAHGLERTLFARTRGERERGE